MPCFLCGLALVIHLRGLEIDLPVASRSAVFWSEAVSTRGISATLAVVGLFLLIALVFVGLGQPMGALFAEMPRLRAYALNVAGALAGIVLFAVNASLWHPPIVWFATSVVVAIPLLAESPRWTWPIHAVLLGGFLTLVIAASHHDTWSPYYRQTLIARDDGDIVLEGNGIPGIVLTGGLDEIGTFMYEAPYCAKTRAVRRRPDAPIHRALIIGCGGGNDVSSALRHGVDHVDAVDINPWVIAMGRDHHPLRPFDSPRVTTYVADGREFLARPGDRYDLIVYGLPDSTFTNDRSNLRVESFLFTLEAFRRVRERLTDDGIFVLDRKSVV